MRSVRSLGPALAVALALAAQPAAASPAPPVPTQAGSPWPSMRHDSRNTGRTSIPAAYHGEAPWAYRTGKGIFSVPVVGADGTVYVGSADSYFYAIRPNGTLRWRLRTGNLIDSAGVLGAYDRTLRSSTLTFGSADDNLYRLSTAVARHCRRHCRPRIAWRFRPTLPPAPGQLVDWWEGNATIGPGGTVYAGNTGGAEYAVNPNGRQRWVFAAGNSIWTDPAFAANGTAYVGSLDAFVYALDPRGQQLWRTPTLGFVISSPAVGGDGTVYVGSFDSKLYALDPATGAPKWTFATGDHIYSSPALLDDAHGNTTAIYVASTDGSVYALDPAGQLLWRYDTGDVIRSSPALGPGSGGHGEILYVGNGAGTVFALDAATGARRWSYDATSTDPVLRDRNDLNSSPALGRTGLYIGSEDGSVDYVPYDYCLHRRDRRCDTNPGQPFGSDLTRVFPVTAGGSNEPNGSVPGTVPTPTTIVARLVVRRGGATQNASMLAAPSPGGLLGSQSGGSPGSASSLVQASPPFDFDAELSGDGRYIFIVPRDFLRPGTDYRIRISGAYGENGARVGNTTVGATGVGSFGDTIHLHTARPRGRLPLGRSSRQVSAFDIRRLAVPIPSFLPSVNQIGFDGYDLLAGTLAKSPPDVHGEGSILLWVVGARSGAHGIEVADPRGNFAFPLSGRYRDDSLLLSDQNLTLTFSFGTVPLQRLDLRMQLARSLRATPGASLFAEVFCPAVPHYGPFLYASGLCNSESKLVANGTFITGPYDRRGPANRRPVGLGVASLTLTRPTADADGSADATFALAAGHRYPVAQHLASLLVTDADSGAVVPLDYRAATTMTSDRHGDLAAVHVAIPKGTSMPSRVRVYAIADVFPLAEAIR